MAAADDKQFTRLGLFKNKLHGFLVDAKRMKVAGSITISTFGPVRWEEGQVVVMESGCETMYPYVMAMDEGAFKEAYEPWPTNST